MPSHAVHGPLRELSGILRRDPDRGPEVILHLVTHLLKAFQSEFPAPPFAGITGMLRDLARRTRLAGSGPQRLDGALESGNAAVAALHPHLVDAAVERETVVPHQIEVLLDAIQAPVLQLEIYSHVTVVAFRREVLHLLIDRRLHPLDRIVLLLEYRILNPELLDLGSQVADDRLLVLHLFDQSLHVGLHFIHTVVEHRDLFVSQFCRQEWVTATGRLRVDWSDRCSLGSPRMDP